MGAMQRRKGQCAELALAGLLTEITGIEVRRKVRQHEGDHDLDGLPGWCIEVKRHATTPRASIAAWWAQAVEQAQRSNGKPALFYRADRGPWRAVWAPNGGNEYQDTCEADPRVWWALQGTQS
jgi:hypothetical protein